jgi:hypothetical protein
MAALLSLAGTLHLWSTTKAFFGGPGVAIVVPRGGSFMSVKADVHATYLGNEAPSLIGYYPNWLDNMADDAVLEGSLLDGAVQGAEAVRSVVKTIRSLYDRQEHKFAGDFGKNRFLEEYVARVHGEPIGCVVLVTRNADGKTRHVVASYRPRSSLMILSRLLHEKFAGTPLGEQFAAAES